MEERDETGEKEQRTLYEEKQRIEEGKQCRKGRPQKGKTVPSCLALRNEGRNYSKNQTNKIVQREELRHGNRAPSDVLEDFIVPRERYALLNTVRRCSRKKRKGYR
ncbi:hypothetical protein E2C01_019749 [Portunus trituberculatus]|uniref:Uncharacterized protein n=1 Tax=Portunus trituberculatus TaxID=210409 RepID=A0A5B7DZH9_PORTR|nr:hypothetical protein [Portunus trituberculatus]